MIIHFWMMEDIRLLTTVTFICFWMMELRHPILDDNNNCYIHSFLNDQSHPIMDDKNNCYIHSFLNDQSHPIMDDNNNCYILPFLVDQRHPILDDNNNCYIHPYLVHSLVWYIFHARTYSLYPKPDDYCSCKRNAGIV